MIIKALFKLFQHREAPRLSVTLHRYAPLYRYNGGVLAPAPERPRHALRPRRSAPDAPLRAAPPPPK